VTAVLSAEQATTATRADDAAPSHQTLITLFLATYAMINRLEVFLKGKYTVGEEILDNHYP
jgi:hypothetical protein